MFLYFYSLLNHETTRLIMWACIRWQMIIVAVFIILLILSVATCGRPSHLAIWSDSKQRDSLLCLGLLAAACGAAPRHLIVCILTQFRMLFIIEQSHGDRLAHWGQLALRMGFLLLRGWPNLSWKWSVEEAVRSRGRCRVQNNRLRRISYQIFRLSLWRGFVLVLQSVNWLVLMQLAHLWMLFRGDGSVWT